MVYKEIAPPDDLASIIECFWFLEHDYRAIFHTHEHLWATVHPELIFSFGAPYYLRTRTGKRELPANLFIGPRQKKLVLYSAGLTGFVAVRFNAWGVFPFSIKPMTELTDNIARADEVFGDGINCLNRRMNRRERARKIELMRQHFQKKFSVNNKARIASAPIGEKISSENGMVKISEVAKHFRIDARRLERVFRSETGLTAKTFARIVRFNRAKRMIERDPNISLSRLTYETGYSDQAHFSKNFRELFDYSPADFKRKLKHFKEETAGQIDVEFLQDHCSRSL
jgi:AraC-like DNA-binding protein